MRPGHVRARPFFPRIRGALLALVLALSAAGCGRQDPGPAVSTDYVPVYRDQWATQRDGTLTEPAGVAIDGAGNIYAADDRDAFIQKFGPDGAPLGRWSRPSGPSNVYYSGEVPTSRVAAAADGSTALVQFHEGLVHRFAPDGRLQATMGDTAGVPGGLRYPRGLAFDPAGNLYVVDGAHYRVVVFDPQGRFLRAWGRECEDPDGFERPAAIAIDAERGVVYVTDDELRRVIAFTPTGEFIRSWGPLFPGRLPLQGASGLAVEPGGTLLVVDAGVPALRRFTPEGRELDSFPLLLPGQNYSRVYNVAVDGQGRIYLADAESRTLRRLTPDGYADGTVGRRLGDRGADFIYLGPLVIDRRGVVFVQSGEYRGLKILTADGRFVRGWDSTHPPESGPGSMDLFAVDAAGEFVLLDERGPALYRLQDDSLFVLRTTLLPPPTESGNFLADEMLFGPDDSIYLARNQGGPFIGRYSATGGYLGRIGGPGDGPGQFRHIAAMALSPLGALWVLDGQLARLSRFTPSGDLLDEVSLAGVLAPSSWATRSLLFDPNGDPLILDEASATLISLSQSGSVRARTGGPGTGPGQFARPSGAAFSPSGRLHVADEANQRIQLFDMGEVPR